MSRPKALNDATCKMVNLPAELVQAVEDYRFHNRVNTEAEAIRLLIEAGLASTGNRPATPENNAPVSLIAALGRVVQKCELETDATYDEVVADGVCGLLSAIYERTGCWRLDTLLGDAEGKLVLAALGGPKYLHAVEEWREARRSWEQSQKRDKGTAPVAPQIPDR